MSLAPGEQRTLVVMESRLRGSNPGLTSMFDLLAAEGVRSRAVRWCLRRRAPGADGRAPLLAVLAAAVVLLAARTAGALGEALRVGLPWDEYGPGASPAGARSPER